MSADESRIFPPPFDAPRKGGGTLRITDVDQLLVLAAEHAGVAPRRLDRRRLEAALRTIGAPPLHAERAVMVLAARARQRRTQALRAGMRRTRAFVGLLVVVFVLALYGVRLEHKLVQKLRVAHARAAELRTARAAVRALAVRRVATGIALAEQDALALELEQVEDRASLVKRRYDDAANDYDAAVRGFPTTPFAHLVGLPSRLPMSWEPDAPGAPRHP